MTGNRSFFLTALTLLLGSTALWAEAPRPVPPKTYDVQFRYRIRAGRNDRIVQYFNFLDFLNTVGFQKDPGPDNEPEDASLDRMTGKISSRNARRLLEDGRVKAILLFPAGYKLPEDGAAPVKVQIEIVGGRSIETQRLFYEQVREQLARLGYKESFLYDHKGYTRLVGTVPAEEVATLLRDLRNQPAGWLAPDTAVKQLPEPLRDVSPLLVIEVIPEPDGVPAAKEAPEPVPVPKGQEKIAPELRRLLGGDGEGDKAERLQMILARTPSASDRTWQQPLLAAVPQLQMEGILGPYVSILLPLSKVTALAALPEVSLVRLPRSGTPLIIPADDAVGGNAAALKASGLAQLHAANQRGRGVRAAVIAGDFRGWEALRGKGLPKNTRLIDLTAERTPSVEPEPYAEGEGKQGHGTLCAMSLALAAPEAELTLIRIDPAAIHQLQAVAAALNGDATRSFSLAQRTAEFEAENDRIRVAWRRLIFERNVLLQGFEQDEEAVKKREEHFKKVQELKDEEANYGKRIQRFLQLQRDLAGLSNVQVVLSALYWNDAYPVDGSSSLTRSFDAQPKTALWFQPAGDAAGQVWTGLFRDGDRNGIMEFAALGAPIRDPRWTPEMNFIAWQPFRSTRLGELPEKATLRVSVQWREVHDPYYFNRGEDIFQEPLARLRLVLLRQRDPGGKKVGADEMEIVARSSGPAFRLQNEAEAATYEIVLEYVVDAAAQYALRVEGQAPLTTRPAGTPAVGETKRIGEIKPRIFMDVTDSTWRPVGRPVFLDYASDEGTIAVPGDARLLFTVGAATRDGRREEFSSPGPALGLALLRKPSFLAYDGLELAIEGPKAVYGTSIASGFAAGLAASVLSADAPIESLRRAWMMQPPDVLRVPEVQRSPRTRR